MGLGQNLREFFWPSWNGTNDNSIPTDTIMINGQAVNASFDTFSLGTETRLYYSDSEKYVKLVESNFVLNSVIDKIGKCLSNANFTDTTQKNSKLLDKANNPNSFQSKEEFLKEFAKYTLSPGYSMVWKRWGSVGFIDTLELININPDNAEILKNSVQFQFQDQTYTIDKNEIIFFYDISRNDKNQKGKSRIKPLRSQVTNINYAQIAKGIQISNSGVTIVSPKAATGSNNIDEGLNTPLITMPTLPGAEPVRTQKDDMEAKLNTRGIQNRIIVATKGIDATNLSQSLANIKFYEIVETDILAIYDTYGFPIELSPYGKNATFENKATAEASLYDNEVMPLAMSFAKSLSADDDLKAFGSLSVDFNHVSAVVSKNNEKNDTDKVIVETFKSLADGQYITAIELREILTDKGILK